MAVWVVKGGRMGERESRFLEGNVVGIGWEELGDLAAVSSREELKDIYRQLDPSMSERRVANQVGQIWAFKHIIQKGDLVVVPLKTLGTIAVGEITSDYQFRTDLGSDMLHTRRVVWRRTDFPRPSFDEDLLYSFGSQLTVCRVTRNDAELRVRAIIEGTRPPAVVDDVSDTQAELSGLTDVEQVAKDQVLKHVGRHFKGHGLARLVDAVLTAEGMRTKVSPPGPDGGVDILAASGPLGLDSPKLCVQVKSSDAPVDVKVFRNLVGTMQAYDAEQGLLVAWGGFKKTVYQEAEKEFFKVRLWASADLLDAVFERYEALPSTMKSELPLKRVWTLALEELE